MARSILSIVLFVLFVYMAAFNFFCLWRCRRNENSYSMGSLVGGISGAVALAICPYKPCIRFWWLPLVLDPGCLFMSILALIYIPPQIYATSRFNLIATLVSERIDNGGIEVKLFKAEICVVQIKRKDGLLSGSATWTYSADILTISLWGGQVIYRASQDNRGSTIYLWQPESTPGHLDGIDLQQVSGHKLI